MTFSRITLTGYKNYPQRTFDFSERLVGICGLNGKGKTNLLDAIYYLGFTRSYFTRSDQMNISFGKEGFRLEGILRTAEDQKHEIVCIYRPSQASQKKEIYLDEVPYEKFSEHLGKFPSVMIAPDDIALITGGSEERRKYLDALISQIHPEYLQQLIRYNKLLAQRNKFLKNTALQGHRDKNLLDALDVQLIPTGNHIHQSRSTFCKRLFPAILRFYKNISEGKEDLGLVYDSRLNDREFEILLKNSLEKDFILQRTNEGIHKDDISFSLGENSFKAIASQGQRKSLLFACKLAEFEMLKEEKGFAPILLLDDVFEKLDEHRIHHLLEYICRQNKGQVFITDTHSGRLKEALQQFAENVQIIELA